MRKRFLIPLLAGTAAVFAVPAFAQPTVADLQAQLAQEQALRATQQMEQQRQLDQIQNRLDAQENQQRAQANQQAIDDQYRSILTDRIPPAEPPLIAGSTASNPARRRALTPEERAKAEARLREIAAQLKELLAE